MRIELKAAILTLLGTIVAALISVVMVQDPPKGKLELVDFHPSAQFVGSSILSVLDFKLANSGGRPVSISRVAITVEKNFRFDMPAPLQFRVPANTVYHANLSRLGEGERTEISLFHQVDAASSDRVIFVLGGSGFTENLDGSLVRKDLSYLARIRVSFFRGDDLLVASRPFDVLVLNQDLGIKVDAAPDLRNSIEASSLKPMTKKSIGKLIHSMKLVAPEWFLSGELP